MQSNSQCHPAVAKPACWLPTALLLSIGFGYMLDAQAKTFYRHSTSQASISGHDGSMNVNGDDVEVHDGIVTVNGISYGTVPQGATVRYVVSGDKKALYVNDELRQPLAAGDR